MSRHRNRLIMVDKDCDDRDRTQSVKSWIIFANPTIRRLRFFDPGSKRIDYQFDALIRNSAPHGLAAVDHDRKVMLVAVTMTLIEQNQRRNHEQGPPGRSCFEQRRRSLEAGYTSRLRRAGSLSLPEYSEHPKCLLDAQCEQCVSTTTVIGGD